MPPIVSLPLLALALLAAPNPTARNNETEAQRLHRKGVHCMDVIEREKCAVEKFEALLGEHSTDRKLMTDAIVRLLRLYDAEQDAERIRDALRRFWQAGMKLGSAGHIPYSARYFPRDVNVLVNIDPPRIIASQFAKTMGADAHDYVFTCDDARRDALQQQWRDKRAERVATRTGQSKPQVLAEMAARERSRQSARARETPIFFVAACSVAKALGHADMAGWTRMTGAFAHDDFRKSIGVAQIPELDAALERAAREGRLKAVSPNRWRVPGVTFAGQPVDVARLDRDELTLASASDMDAIVAASAKGKRRMDKNLWGLVKEVPDDTAMFVVMTDEALEGLGMPSMRGGGRLLKALLPRPDGLQMAAIFHDQLGLFARVPTDTPVRARMLVDFAQRVLEGRADKDPQAARFLESFDIAEASDRKAVLMSYLISAGRLKALTEP